jgi:hypothetical protein
VAWLAEAIGSLVYGAWLAVADGNLARADAPRVVSETLLGGIGTSPARGR